MNELLEVRNVRRSFPRSGGEELLVLEDVNLSLKEGEIVGLLGRSGSGKSTLLRLIAGLASPQGGSLTYMGAPINGPAQGVAMVFQGFALFPWMTVLQNVELGLEARKGKEKAFFELAERFRNADDPRQARQLGDKLGRLVFGE